MKIRHERCNDIEKIYEVVWQAFENHPMHEPGTPPFEPAIVEKLRGKGGLSLSLVAEKEGKIVGHLAMSPARIGSEEGGWYLLGPLGVLPSMQRSGIGSALVRHGLEEMRRMGADGIVLVGDPGYYNRFGFKALDCISYPGVPSVFVLTFPFVETLPSGDIVPHKAFDLESL